MGFYGNITNVNKSTFQFDKIYPNRVAMDAAATTDGIFSGRYVLVDYDEGASLDSITEVFNSNVESISSGNVVIIPGYKRKIWNAESEEYHDAAPRQFYTGLPSYLPDESDLDETSIYLLDKDSILAGTYVLCLGVIEEKTENIGTENEPNLKTTYHLNQNEPKKLYMAVINNDTLDFEDVVSSFNTLVDLFGSNFLINYTVDVKYYENKGISIGRGWDSTVWQKTYKDGKMTYVMVAELNSVVPTFDIAVDAPTESLTKPYWDSDSSNVYYKLHVPAVKSLRIRSASGEDSKNNEGVWSNDQSTWKEYKTDFEEEDLAIYWNKEGFEKYIPNINAVEKDNILLEYTGFSDNYYNDNRKNSPTYAQQVLHEFPDTYELSMCLPSIGNAAAQFWNMVYGEGKVKDTLGKYLYDKDKIKFAEDDESVLIRNTNYEWNTRNGERASKIFDENLEKTVYGYNSDALNNLAGSINSLHDLIGMNIIKKGGLTENSDSSQFDPHNIYYSNGKYFRKEKAYKIGKNIGISGSNMIDPSKGNYYRLESYAYQNYEKEDHSEEEYHNYWKVQPNDIIKEDEVYGIVTGTPAPKLTVENFDPLTEDENEFLYTRSNSAPYVYEKVTNNILTSKDYYKITSVQQVNNKEIFYLPGLYYLGVKHFENLEEKNEWLNKSFENRDYDSLSLRNEERMNDALKAVRAIDNQGNENELVIANFLKGVKLDTEATTYVYVDKNLIQEDVAQNDGHLNIDGTVYTLTIGSNTYSSPLQNKTNSIIEVDGTAVPSYHYYAQVYRKTGGTELHSLQYWAEHPIGSSEALILVQDLRREISQPVYSLNNARVVELQDIEGDYLNYYWKSANEYIYGQLTKNDIKQYYKDGTGQAAAVWFTLNISNPQIYYNLDTGYYLKDSNGNYIRETATRLKAIEGVDVNNYYTVTWEPITKRIFIPNTYYYYEDNTWKLETDLNSGRVYYRYPGVYVVSDENNRYPVGFRWKAPDVIPEGLTWGNKGFDWKLKEIPELADGENTIHGLILKINKMLSAGDKITRDDSTVQGSINSLNDITSNFNELNSGEILMSDKLRRIHSASASGDDWIKITTTPGENPDFKPTIKLEHKFTGRADETSNLDLNSNNIDNKDVIELYTPQLDNKGHVVAKNIKTVTLPYGFKTVSIGAESSVVGNLAHAAADLVAENTQDTLTINSGNKWVKLAGAANNDSFSIGHLVQSIETTAASNSDINDNGDTITIQDITNDEAGHITANKAHTYTLPYGFKTITGNNGSLVADSTQATAAFNGDTWIQTTASSTGVEFTHNNPDNITHTTVNNETPNFGETFTIKDLDFDSKGHKANDGTHTVTLPLPTVQDAKEVVSGIEQPVQGNVLIDLAVDKDNTINTSTGTFTKTKAYVGNLQLNGYNKNDVDIDNLDLSYQDTLNQALEKLDYRLTNESASGAIERVEKIEKWLPQRSSASNGTMQKIADVVMSYIRHNDDLAYMHRPNAAYNYGTGHYMVWENENNQDVGAPYSENETYPENARHRFFGWNGLEVGVDNDNNKLSVTRGPSGTSSGSYPNKTGEAINCISFASLVMLGIPYEASRYINSIDQNTSTLNVGRAGYCFNPWNDKIDGNPLDDTYGIGLYDSTDKMRNYFEKVGIGEQIAVDFSNVYPGDLIFERRSISGTTYHVGIVLHKYGASYNDELSAPQVLIAECSNSAMPVKLTLLSLSDLNKDIRSDGTKDGWSYVGHPIYQECPLHQEEVLLTQDTAYENCHWDISNLDVTASDLLTLCFTFTPQDISENQNDSDNTEISGSTQSGNEDEDQTDTDGADDQSYDATDSQFISIITRIDQTTEEGYSYPYTSVYRFPRNITRSEKFGINEIDTSYDITIPFVPRPYNKTTYTAEGDYANPNKVNQLVFKNPVNGSREQIVGFGIRIKPSCENKSRTISNLRLIKGLPGNGTHKPIWYLTDLNNLKDLLLNSFPICENHRDFKTYDVLISSSNSLSIDNINLNPSDVIPAKVMIVSNNKKIDKIRMIINTIDGDAELIGTRNSDDNYTWSE